MKFSSPQEIASATWADLEPAFDELIARPVDLTTVEAWLAEWSRLEEIVTEAISKAMIAYTCDTTDPAKEAAHRRFSVEIAPKADEKSVKLAERLVRLGWQRPDLEQAISRFRRAVEIFREENVPLAAELEETSTEYQRTTGGFMAEWEGESKPLPQLAPFLQSNDRTVRERAFRGIVGPYLGERDHLADLFQRQVDRRRKVASNAGFSNYQDYAFAAKCRFDYTPGDCRRFHRSVEEIAVPAVRRLLEYRKSKLGLSTLRPWDLAVNLYRDEPLRPFSTGNELAAKAHRVFLSLDTSLAGEFQTMIDEQLLDLDSRKGKAPGGYCDTLHFRGRPFIFMNAVGLMDDVQTLLHEAGHAFHAFAAHRHPLIWQRHPSSEAAELASMSMELLAAPLLNVSGGFLNERDTAIARVEHLEDILSTLCHVASIDAFQSWLYTDPLANNADARDRGWIEIRARFEPDIDWTGIERERVARWYRQLHIFLYPFYYIEYGIAQLGALQVWQNHQRNAAEALSAYRRFMALGATASLPKLYEAAGAALIFDRGPMERLVNAVETEIDRLRTIIG